MTIATDTFQALGLNTSILQALTDIGYETPSPIQAACIPHLLAGHDLLGEAQTGTGKTGAFALPLLNRLELNNHYPQVLVLAPTRELAIQVAEAFQSYAKHLSGFHVLPIYGGQSMSVQLRQLKRGAHVIVGTPGRIIDHIKRKSLVLDSLTTLVLDEADEMLRMGFIDDVEWILQHTPETRQTALFSATMPDPIRRVAHRYLREPQEIKIKASTTTVKTIRQCYCQVNGAHKLDALTRILETESNLDAALIFVRTKTATVELAEKLEARGYAAAALNGDMTQQLRERAVEQLKRGTLDIVIATDVAARGLDVSRVSHVINYDIPYDTEAYVHRIGRTGRAGRTGTAILFATPREMRMLKTIERATRQPITPLPLPSRKTVADHRITQFRQQIETVLESENLGFFVDIITDIESRCDTDLHEIAAALAFLAQQERPLQLPTTNSPDFADFSPEKGEYGKSERAGTKKTEKRDNHEKILERRRDYSNGKLLRYRIEVGHNQQVTARDIVGAIANEAGISSQHIGQINLYEDYATVELPGNLTKEILTVLRKVRIRQHLLAISTDDSPHDMPHRAARKPAGHKDAWSDNKKNAKPSGPSFTRDKKVKKDDKPKKKKAPKP